MTLYNFVLLLEDDEDDQDFFKSALNQIFPDINCMVLPNGQEGLIFLKSDSKPDIIFSDIRMPLINGKQFLNEYFTREVSAPKCPVVILSTSQAVNEMEECIKMGACHYLVKPAAWGILLKELNYILTRQWV